jgi:hypothetical protein
MALAAALPIFTWIVLCFLGAGFPSGGGGEGEEGAGDAMMIFFS